MLSPPKLLDEIQPNLVCELLTWIGRATAFFGPRPMGPWGEVKRSNIILFQLQSQFQRFFIPNFVCVLTNERYKIYQTGFLFYRLGHILGVGLGVHRVKNQIPSCCLSVMLSAPKSLDDIQPNLV